MSWVEFQKWAAFYRRCPFDDFHLSVLPAAIQISASAGVEVTDVIATLTGQPVEPKQPEQREPETSDQVDLSVFAAFGIVPPKSFTNRTNEAAD